MKKILFFFTLFLSLITLPAQAATIRINSPKITLELAPGDTYSGEIVAENPADQEAKVRLYLEDWVYKPTGIGDKEFTPAGTLPNSASRWITFSPAEDVLKPYGRITIRYTINVPKEVKGGYYSVLFIETLLGAAQNEEGVSVLVAGRIGALFLIEAKGTALRQGQIQSVEVKAGGNKPLQILTTFKNTGNIDTQLQGKFLLMDQAGKIYGRGDLANMYLMPGDAATSTTEWVGRLSQGSYTALLTYDLGKGQTMVSEKTFSVE